MAYLGEDEDDVTMDDVIKNVEAQIAENERRRRQRNEERRRRNAERRNRRFNRNHNANGSQANRADAKPEQKSAESAE